jgi:hypothetical protein
LPVFIFITPLLATPPSLAITDITGHWPLRLPLPMPIELPYYADFRQPPMLMIMPFSPIAVTPPQLPLFSFS